MENAEGCIMKPAFVMLCYMLGVPTGNLIHYSNMHNCLYFSKYLSEQAPVTIAGETNKLECYCKNVWVNEQMRLY